MPSWIDYGKIRTSYGIVGNAPQAYAANMAYTFGRAPGWSYNQVPADLGNESLRPETTKEFEAGLESRFLKNRIGLEVNYYNKKITDMLLQTSLAPSSGSSTMWVNSGSMSNKGWEIAANFTPFDKRDFYMNINTNLGFNRNEILSLVEGINFIETGDFASKVGKNYSYVGRPMGDMYAATNQVVEDGPYKGRNIVNASGQYVMTNDYQLIGNAMPKCVGGLGFNYKWNMGWMNDMLLYMSLDPIYRAFNHDKITFSFFYCFSENFVLPISHDEVVYGKCSLLEKMSGNEEQKFSSYRAFLCYMMAHPGKKLLFMGPELGQWKEWNYETQLDWELLTQERNRRTKDFFKMMNHFYLENSELWEKDLSWEGFEWLVVDDNRNNVIAYARKNKAGDELICIVNFSPVKFEHYRIPVLPYEKYLPIINTDDAVFGREDFGYKEPILTEWIHKGKMDSSICVKLPPRAGLILKASGKLMAKPKAAQNARSKRTRAKLRATRKNKCATSN